MKKPEEIKKIVKEKYAKIATGSLCCSCGCKTENDISKSIGYSNEDVLIEGNLGLGCGNPLAFSKIKEGDTVLDLGCGAGFDCFLAAKRVKEKGKVIGVDMTKDMIERAKENAKRRKVKNVQFILSEIEEMPIKDNSIDIIITNCVINLAPDKLKVFKKAYRVLKKGGKIFLSDIVLLKELSEKQKNDENLLAGCVAGALLKEDYLAKLKEAGFKINILNENRKISKEQYNGIDLMSLTLEAVK
ncbi:MAG: arsenite methyltransferase [Candidatus Paceibacterota bacterium]|nr:arsenite methyltransferase [Candidatus Paceibacterota bacterium]MDD3072237.1 arsenite methyltransferase [Candidatus Paceibacterota bacterium]MDD4201194.1 arsenite methyltransferase [Candidatus Paceibacterota bacterium]MDD4897229.1 arsenite methyltransferase [Candidatus Paceibacterota bacterium]